MTRFIEDNSTFEEGVWNGDGDFHTADMIFAFAVGTYQNSAVADRSAREPMIDALFRDDKRLKLRVSESEIDDAFTSDLLRG